MIVVNYSRMLLILIVKLCKYLLKRTRLAIATKATATTELRRMKQREMKNKKKELRSDMDNNNNITKQDGSCLQLPSLKVIHCDLETSLLPRMKHQVDIILFNPPYVPTEDCEVMDIDGTTIITTTACEGDRDIENYIAAAWAGGKHGRRVIDRAIPQIAQLLRKTVVDTQDGDGGSCSRGQRGGGVAYMVTVDDNQPEELNTTLMQSTQLEMIPLLRRRARNEQLTIQKISWK